MAYAAKITYGLPPALRAPGNDVLDDDPVRVDRDSALMGILPCEADGTDHDCSDCEEAAQHQENNGAGIGNGHFSEVLTGHVIGQNGRDRHRQHQAGTQNHGVPQASRR